MNRKKKMKLWQMIVLLILSAGLLATLFVPAYHVTPEALDKSMESARDDEDKDSEDGEKDKDEKDKDSNKAYTDGFKDKLDKKEKNEGGINIESISVLKLMTKSFTDICYNGEYDEDQARSDMGEDIYDALDKRHNITRILLWAVYGLLLAVILITILGFCLKWIKYIPLAVSTVYGVFASAVFAVLRFAVISGVAEETGTLTEDFIGMRFKDAGIEADKIAPGFLSFAFLLGLVLAAAFLAVSLLSMFVGDQADAYEGEETEPWKGWSRTVVEPPIPTPIPIDHNSGIERQGVHSGSQVKTIPSELAGGGPSENESQKQKDIAQPVRPPVRTGKVRCTKGVTSGPSGYALTPDRKVVVGKSPHQANLVIVNNAHISNVHCTVRYEPGTDSYIVKDHSSNGTFVNGVKMQKGAAIAYPAGTVLKLADGSVEITLG